MQTPNPKGIDWESIDFVDPDDPRVRTAIDRFDRGSPMTGRGTAMPEHFPVYLSKYDAQPIQAAVFRTVKRERVLVTADPLLRSGDIVFLDVNRSRAPYRIADMRRGMRVGDAPELRIGNLVELPI